MTRTRGGLLSMRSPRSCSRSRSPGMRPPPGSSATPSAACSRTRDAGRPCAERPELIPPRWRRPCSYDPSVPVWRRVTTRPAKLGWCHGSPRAPSCSVAGRRGRRRPPCSSGRTFDLYRPNADQHLAFGKGLHYCLGANLGKLEAQIAIAHLARRYPISAARARPAARLPPQHLLPRTAGNEGAYRPGLTSVT